MEDFTKKDIDNIVYDILKQSKAFDKYPTPVNEIVDYSGLYIDRKAGLHSIPNNYISKGIRHLQKALKKVYGAFDRRNKIVYLEPNIITQKKRFVKLHEVGHGVIPWQRKTFEFIEDESTLSAETEEQFESEANYFASGTLFQLDRFEEEMNKLPLHINSAMFLAKCFGGSIHAALRRYVENSKRSCSLLVLEKNSTPFLNLKKQFASTRFDKYFGFIQWPMKMGVEYVFVYDYIKGRKVNFSGEITLMTINGLSQFNYHYFDNTYNIFVFIFPKGEAIRSRTKIYLKQY